MDDECALTGNQRRSQDYCLGGATRPMSPGTFYVISRSRPGSVGAGGSVVAEFFRVAPGGQQSDYLNSGTFFYVSYSKNVTTSIHCNKKNIYQKFGGAMALAPLATQLLGMDVVRAPHKV